MTDRDRILRRLTIHPEDLAFWTEMCRRAARQTYLAHPDYPRLEEMQFLSFVKRPLPGVRALVASLDAGPGDKSA